MSSRNFINMYLLLSGFISRGNLQVDVNLFPHCFCSVEMENIECENSVEHVVAVSSFLDLLFEYFIELCVIMSLTL